ncbi:uncharacterized protein DUF2188 [Anseongella ginsenosidimutans]|uniref:Uncharacterized protein DUF2188 n=1 Tax=Anseongella ginsenosidimutans TaxID=496056 RepID=A0A4R3KJM9_9SPHI|nr:DUF2188 domain-containing protein [Anseongella ginsenosidimutans]QEC53608.1 DUF2188 domain-containing protein [Anseongella ginsenosidimutans]TCS83953.1 uncharacterized protein DUF2188 [Anseongella ginsenosidimutans]
MAKRKTYHVTKTEEGWQGMLENGKRASVTGNTKEETLGKTIDLAKKQGNSSIIVHKQDGKIQEERTYGNDPYPPKG